MHVIEKAGNFAKELATHVTGQSTGKREFCVYLSNGTEEDLTWVGTEGNSAGSCSKSFGQVIGAGRAGSIRFSAEGDLAGEVLLECTGCTIITSIRAPARGISSVSIHATAERATRTSQGSLLSGSFKNSGGVKIPTAPGELNIGDLPGTDFAYSLHVDGKGTGNVAHVFVGKKADIAKDEKDKALFSGRFAAEGLSSSQLLTFSEWCSASSASFAKCAVFLLEYNAVLRGLLHLETTDAAFMVDLLVEAFCSNGLLYSDGALPAGALDEEVSSWRSLLPEFSGSKLGYQEFIQMLAAQEALPEHIDAAMALLKTAALQCGIALQQSISSWLAGGQKASSRKHIQHRPARGASKEAEDSCAMLHKHLTQGKIEAAPDPNKAPIPATQKTPSKGVSAEILIDLVRESISVSADFTLRRKELFEKLCGAAWPKNTPEAPMTRYREWMPAARRDFELKAQDFEEEVSTKCCWRSSSKPPETGPKTRPACHVIGAELFANIDAGTTTSPELMLESLGEDSLPYKSMATNSKSGEFFFFSGDRRFIVKTISEAEGALLHRMLPAYQAHLRAGRSLIVRYGGLYRMVLPQLATPIYFSVMASVFDPAYPIHEVFDLKGSMQGRRRKEGEKEGKDEDWVKQERRLLISDSVRCELTAAHERDAAFLRAAGVMDYSLLLGIHNLAEGSKLGSGFCKTGMGIWAEGARCCYFVGLIDFLIAFDIGKKGEHIFRAVQGHSEDASCVDPVSYARRQVQFVREKVVIGASEGAPLGTHGTLRILVQSAENLVKADFMNHSDPYLCAGIGLQLQRTQTVDNDCNPQWNRTLLLGVNEAGLSGDLELSVWDEDAKHFQGTDDFLGRLTIPMSRIVQAGKLEVKERLTGVDQGTLNVQIELLTP